VSPTDLSPTALRVTTDKTETAPGPPPQGSGAGAASSGPCGVGTARRNVHSLDTEAIPTSGEVPTRVWSMVDQVSL